LVFQQNSRHSLAQKSARGRRRFPELPAGREDRIRDHLRPETGFLRLRLDSPRHGGLFTLAPGINVMIEIWRNFESTKDFHFLESDDFRKHIATS
jgi:hypothetical protein